MIQLRCAFCGGLADAHVMIYDGATCRYVAANRKPNGEAIVCATGAKTSPITALYDDRLAFMNKLESLDNLTPEQEKFFRYVMDEWINPE